MAPDSSTHRPTRLIGSRGSRRSAGVRFTPPPPPEPPGAPKVVTLAPPARRADAWLDTVLLFLGRRRAAPGPVRKSEGARAAPAPRDVSPGESSLDLGLRDIRRTDPGFDPSRFAGYIGMIFRTAQHAWMTGDVASLREQVTPEMYGEMQARYDRLRSAGRVNRVAHVDITATITEAWQESDRDYVTADIGGSIVDYTVEEAGDRLVEGSRTVPRPVEEFWTFTRPAGLNFWMLSAIQT